MTTFYALDTVTGTLHRWPQFEKKKKRFKKLQLNQSDENNTWARISDTKCYVRAG